MTDSPQSPDAAASCVSSGHPRQRKATLRERIARSRSGGPAPGENTLAADLAARLVPGEPASAIDDAAPASEVTRPDGTKFLARKPTATSHPAPVLPDRPVIQPPGYEPTRPSTRTDLDRSALTPPVPAAAPFAPAAARSVPAVTRIGSASTDTVSPLPIAIGARRHAPVRRIVAAAAGITLLAGLGGTAALLLARQDEPAAPGQARDALPETVALGLPDERLSEAGIASPAAEAHGSRRVGQTARMTSRAQTTSSARSLLAAEDDIGLEAGDNDPALIPTGTDRMAFATELLPDSGLWAAARGADLVDDPPIVPASGEVAGARIEASFTAIAGAPALLPDEFGLEADTAIEEPRSVAEDETSGVESVPLPKPAPERETVRTASREQAGTAAEPAATARRARAVRAVNMRARPKNGATTITIVPGGSRLDVVGCDHWCRVIYNGKEGYIYKSFVSGT